MYQRDYRDIVTGALFALAGGFIVWHASGLDLGSLRRVGPGLFPTALGYLLAAFGLLIMVPAFFRAGQAQKFEVRSALSILGSVGVFAAAIRPLGLVPAILGLIIVSSFAEPVFRPRALLGMLVVLPLGAYLVFNVGLGLPLAMFRSPF